MSEHDQLTDEELAALPHDVMWNGPASKNGQVVPIQRHDDTGGNTGNDTQRRVVLTPASQIRMRATHWLWDKRIPIGGLTLLAGRESVGKSTLTAELVARITRGQLNGDRHGHPRSVIVAAAEESWAGTIAPRLYAAGADLDRVYRVDVTTDGLEGALSLPRDMSQLEAHIGEVDAALVLLDPLTSRLSESLDTHKDSDVRLALEPLVKMADRASVSVLGLIHVNKGTSNDPLNSVMGSRAFGAVARAVLYALTDPDDEQQRIIGIAKSNLGPTDLPSFTFRIESHQFADDLGDSIETSKLVWTGENTQSVRATIEAAQQSPEARTATDEAADWLLGHLENNGGVDDSANIKEEAKKAGHSHNTLHRARVQLQVRSNSEGFPRRTYWTLPGTQSADRSDK